MWCSTDSLLINLRSMVLALSPRGSHWLGTEGGFCGREWKRHGSNYSSTTKRSSSLLVFSLIFFFFLFFLENVKEN